MSMPIDDSLLRRLRKQASPAPALDHPSPAAGQLWRAYWRTSNQETACLVLVVKDAPIGVRNVDVVPVSEASVGDDSAVAIETDNGFKASAWTGIGRRIYKFTLDLRVGDLTAASADRLRAVLGGDDAGDWSPIFNVLDDRSLERADLQDRLEALASADWTRTHDDARATVDELATAAGVNNSAIAEALHITPGDAQRLRRGLRLPRQDELSPLIDLLGAAPAVSMSFDEILLAELDEPELRPLLRQRAEEKHHGDEIAARRQIAERVMATSFRQQASGARNWKQAILDALAED